MAEPPGQFIALQAINVLKETISEELFYCYTCLIFDEYLNFVISLLLFKLHP